MPSNLPTWVRGSLRAKFDGVEPGETFTIPVDEQSCTWPSFKVQVSVHNRKLTPKRFHSRKHEDGTFEVYRSK